MIIAGKPRRATPNKRQGKTDPPPVALDDLPEALEELLDVWQAQASFRTAVSSKTSGWQFSVPNVKGVKDRADKLSELVLEMKDHDKVKILRVDDVVNDAKLAFDELAKFSTSIDTWKPALDVNDKRLVLEKLFAIYDKCCIKVESHIHALKKLRDETQVSEKADANKVKKRINGCIVRFFATLTTMNVPKFLAKVANRTH